MTSQGHSQKVGTTGCPCVPAHPASFISQCLPAGQQEDTSKDKWLLYKVSDSSMLYSGPVPTTAFSIDPNCPPPHPPTNNKFAYFFESCSPLCVSIKGV